MITLASHIKSLDELADECIEAIEKRNLDEKIELASVSIIVVNTLEHAGMPKLSRHVKVLLEDMLTLIAESEKGDCCRD